MLYPRNGYSKLPAILQIQSQRCSAATGWMQPYESSVTPRFKMRWNQKRLPRVRCAEDWSGRGDLNLSRLAGVGSVAAGFRRRNPDRSEGSLGASGRDGQI